MFKKVWDIATSKTAMALLTVAGVAIGIYGLYPSRPDLVIDTVGDTRVLDVYASISKLDITYAGQSLKASNRELRILSVRVANVGKADITKASFDSEDPVGFQIVGGSLLEPPTLSGSSKYLSQYANFTPRDPSTLVLDPIIIDAGEWIQLKLLVAVRAGDNPSILPMGKIAGAKSVRSVSSARDQLTRPVWNRIVGADSLWIQLGRLPIYFGATLLFVVFIGLFVLSVIAVIIQPIKWLLQLPARIRRRKIIQTYKKMRTVGAADHCVLDEYLELGSVAIPSIRQYLDSVAAHNSDARECAAIRTTLVAGFGEPAVDKKVVIIPPARIRPLTRPRDLGLQRKDGNAVVVDPSLAIALSDFDKYLRASGETPPDTAPEEPDVDRQFMMEGLRIRAWPDDEAE